MFKCLNFYFKSQNCKNEELMNSILNENENEVIFCINHKADPFFKNSYGEDSRMIASGVGNLNIVKSLIKEPIFLNDCLNYASYFHHLNVVEFLIQHVQYNFTTYISIEYALSTQSLTFLKSNGSCLYNKQRNYNSQVVITLLNNCQYLERYKEIFLYLSCVRNDEKVIFYLIDKDAKFSVDSIRQLIFHNNYKILNHILSNNLLYHINYCENDGKILSASIYAKNYNITEMLVRHGSIVTKITEHMDNYEKRIIQNEMLLRNEVL